MKITKRYLHYNYVILNKSSDQIGKELGCSGRNIRYHLFKNGFKINMIKKRQTSGLGKDPINKGIVKTKSPKLGRYYVNIKGRCYPRSRYIMEKHIGRKLKRNEIVHHIDGNPLNDAIENLHLLSSQKEHIKIHKPHLSKRNRTP